MYRWQLEGLVDKVAKDIKSQKEKSEKKSPNLLARRRVEGLNITHKPDVKRLARKICKELSDRNKAKQASIRADRALQKRISP